MAEFITEEPWTCTVKLTGDDIRIITSALTYKCNTAAKILASVKRDEEAHLDSVSMDEIKQLISFFVQMLYPDDK